ncbi:MAG: PIG-L deacetylase family protein [Egicoccus sp.]
MIPATPRDLVDYAHVLAVCAHPDDESFGLGAIISGLTGRGAIVDLVCFTHGEGSTLGAGDDLAERRTEELGCAAQVLGIGEVFLHHHPDGDLAAVAVDDLVAHVGAAVGMPGRATALLTFDEGGITGHPDHDAATRAAVAAGRDLDLPVYAWAIAEPVARHLRDEFGAPFVGRDAHDLDVELHVERRAQAAATDCHGSQLFDNPVPRRRVELQGDIEYLRVLHLPA